MPLHFVRIANPLFALACLAALTACGDNANQTGEAIGGIEAGKAIPQPGDIRVYGVKQGKIVYEVTGFQAGKATTYWEDWGMREAETSEISVEIGDDRMVSLKMLSLRLPEGLVVADLKARTGRKSVNPIFAFLDDSGLSSGTELGEKWIESMGGVRDGQSEVAGKTCDVWVVEQLGGKLCIWKGLMLKQEAQVEGRRFTKTAISIEPDLAIPQGTFDVPTNLQFEPKPFAPEPPSAG